MPNSWHIWAKHWTILLRLQCTVCNNNQRTCNKNYNIFKAEQQLYTKFSALVKEEVRIGSLTVTYRTCNPQVTRGRRFDSAPGHCQVTTLGKLFTHVPQSPSSIIWYRLHFWDVNRHTARYTGLISVVSQCKNWCLAEGLRKRRTAPPYGP